jgi:hypothetical protein
VTPEEWDAGGELVAAFEALDDWIGRGGFLPDDWKPEEFGFEGTF